MDEKEKEFFQIAPSEDFESLRYYEFTIDHKLRASWARVCGLVDILDRPQPEDEKNKIKALLSETLDEMDSAMREVSRRLYKHRMNNK